MPDTLTGLAPAKINLTLEVGDTRPDGYHDLTSILQTLALADEVALEPAAETSIENTGPFAGGSPAGPENLAWRAIDALAEIESKAALKVGRSDSDALVPVIDLFRRTPMGAKVIVL